MSGYLTAEQTAQLLKPINPARVQRLDNLSHLAAYDVRAHLNRIFGFARWSADVLDVTQLFEDVQLGVERTRKNGSTYKADIVSVGYRATLRLTVCAPDGTVLASYTEAATGDACNFPVTKRADAHDFAIKTAESQALKRCAANLGDQFGLSLYGGGSMTALVGRTLVVPGADSPAGDVQEGAAPVTPEAAPAVDEPHVEQPAPRRVPADVLAAKHQVWQAWQQVGGTSRDELAEVYAQQSGGLLIGDAGPDELFRFADHLRSLIDPGDEIADEGGRADAALDGHLSSVGGAG